MVAERELDVDEVARPARASSTRSSGRSSASARRWSSSCSASSPTGTSSSRTSRASRRPSRHGRSRGHVARVRAHPVHARPDAVRRHRLVDLQPARGRLRVPAGPIFTNLLLADEINRAPPKTQAALLEAMQERQVTIEGARTRSPAVRRARDAEPDRVRGHLPAPRGAARPLPAAHLHRLSRRRTTSGACSRRAPSGRRTRWSCRRSSTARRCSRCSGRWNAFTSRSRSAATWSTSSARRGRAAGSPSAPARAARSRC